MKEKIKIVYTDTFKAEMDIVIHPEKIKYYSPKRDDYAKLCDIAIKQNINTFLLIDDSVANYKELGTRAIITEPFLVSNISIDNKYYYFFWEIAISICYKVLEIIDNDKKELFLLVEKTIQEEPLAIFFVNSKISIYSKLCNMAYKKNKESLKYMDINYVDKNIVFEILKREPDRIRNLDNTKEYYKKAWKLALSLDGKLIKYVRESVIENNLDYFFDLVNTAFRNNPTIVDYPIVLRALSLENRERKEKLLSTPNVFGNNLSKLLNEIEDEYKLLSKKYVDSLFKESEETKKIYSDPNTICPIKIRTRKN